MDKNTELLLDLTKNQQAPPQGEPVTYDVKTLMEEAAQRIYTREGQRLVEAVRCRAANND